jgi:hypothetical protein
MPPSIVARSVQDHPASRTLGMGIAPPRETHSLALSDGDAATLADFSDETLLLIGPVHSRQQATTAIDAADNPRYSRKFGHISPRGVDERVQIG